MTEKQMYEAEVPWFSTIGELIDYIAELVEQEHDYGTCIYAMSMAAVAAFYYVSKRLGVTGLQASCADMDILRRTRGLKHGFRIIDYGNLLYPQYCSEEHFPSWETLIHQNAKVLKEEAEKILNQKGHILHPDVREHLEKLANMVIDEEEKNMRDFIDIDEVMEIADKKYVEKKRNKYPYDTNPEYLPDGIISDQIKALAEAVCEVLNKEISRLKYRRD